MFGSGSAKLGRGGGGGRGPKRNNSPYPPPPLNRSIPPQSGGRLSMGGGGGAASRNRQTKTAAPVAAAPSTAPEETFDLVSGNQLAFAMIIRLAPNLIDEIRRVEAQGGTARIKFDPNAKNSDGNVIDVGGKDFRFTWSHEPGDLCDIYEERQSGENGSGLLVESGGAWRKLNVERVLDESTKNHVKMRSEEAERRSKSRKAIILDHGNPSVNNQMKTSVVSAVEGRMPSKLRKEPPFKKRKVEPTQASGGPSKSVFKSGLSSTNTVRGRLSVSPVPSPPEQSRPSASPLGVRNLSKSLISAEEVAPKVTSKEENTNTMKDISSRVIHATVPPGNKEGLNASPVDLRRMLVSILTENPRGLSFKALEKAVGDPTMKIKPILEKIAVYQAPGRYILKEGLELESFKKPSFDSGSSSEFIPNQATNLEKASPDKFEHHSRLSPQLEVSDLVEKINNQHDSTDLFVDKKATDHGEVRAGSSSGSGTDSDSGSDSGSDSSSDSGSQSRSRSKSRSPAGSGNSSDSSDGCSSNKQGSDVDVDIMTSDDEKEEADHKVQSHEQELFTSPFIWKADSHCELNGSNGDKQADQIYSAAGISKESPIDEDEHGLIDITGSTPVRASVRSSQEATPFSTDPYPQGEGQQFLSGNNINQRQNNNDGASFEHYKSSERISSSTMNSGLKDYDEKFESARRKEVGSSGQTMTSERTKETMFLHPDYLSPYRPPQDQSKDQTMQVMDRLVDTTADTGSQRVSGPSLPLRSHPDDQSSQRRADRKEPGSAPDVFERDKKPVQKPGRGNKSIGRGPVLQDESDGSGFKSTNVYDKVSTEKSKVNRETLDEDGYAYGTTKDVREGAVGDKMSMPFNSQYRKQGEQVGKLTDAGQTTYSHLEAFSKERSPVVNGRGKLLRREPSDLELGEFREPTQGEDNHGAKKKFEKKHSFKLSESSTNASDNLTSDSNKGRSVRKTNQEFPKHLSPESGIGIFGDQEDSYRRKIVGDDIEESTRPQQGISIPDVHQFPKVDHSSAEGGIELNKPADKGTKSGKNETRKRQGAAQQGYESTSRKVSVNVPQQHDIRDEGRIVSPKTIKKPNLEKSNAGRLLKKQENYWAEYSDNNQKRKEFSSEEDNCVYYKYEKDEPELKGPIKDFPEYKQYVQEYREKYDSYCSLNTSLQTYRSDFSKYGHDLQLAKDRDSEEYYQILEHLRENYRQCGNRYKRLKKVFLVLHEELKCLKKSIKDFAVSYSKD